MKEFFKRILGGSKSEPKSVAELTPEPPASKKQRQTRVSKSAKELATDRGEPYVAILSVDLDPDNIGAGAFELDWNDKFLANLVRAGFQKKLNEPEHVIVDRWFQEVCRNVVLETYEQEQADPDLRRVSKRNLGDGRTEVG